MLSCPTGAGPEADKVTIASASPITARARAQLKFRSRVQLPGPILRSNGKTEPDGTPNARLWRIDAEGDAKDHEILGRGPIVMKMLVERETVAWARESFRPVPGESPGSGQQAPPAPLGRD